jgi:hypothetical protein
MQDKSSCGKEISYCSNESNGVDSQSGKNLNLSGITTLAKLCTFPTTNWADGDEDMQNKQYQDEHHCSTQAT